MTDADAYLQQLIESNPLREPVIRSVIQAAALPPDSRGLDVGCGYGAQVRLLSEAVGPAGHVTGVDVRREFVAYARDVARRAGLADRVTFQEGDMYALPFDAAAFDWAWSMDCVGYGPGDPLPPLRELARVVRPGGVIAVAAWSSEQLLPGYPLLEARLRATAPGIAPFAHGQKPETHFLRTLGAFRALGIEDAAARTLVGEVRAPLTDGVRHALTGLLQMRWGGAQGEVSGADWAAFQRLCQPASPDFILALPDYYAFFTYTLFRGRVAPAWPDRAADAG